MALMFKSTQVLSTAYGAAVEIDSGWELLSVTLDDANIGFKVEIDAANEEAAPAGSSWGIQTPNDNKQGISIKVKADSGTPTASLIWFR
jgi:predicted thioesterase